MHYASINLSFLSLIDGDIRAECALHMNTVSTIKSYATISQIRCFRGFASCHGPGNRMEGDIFQTGCR